jgi:long-subunit acyl-CoA synthetase (AMP-forming)
MTGDPWGDRRVPPGSFADLLIEAVRRHADRPALRILGPVRPEDSASTAAESLTWAEVGGLVAAACRWLVQRGAPGRLSLVGEPTPGYQILEMAALVSGWSVNPIYCDAAPDEAERVLAAVQPRVIATDRPGVHWRAGEAAGAEVVDLGELFADWRVSSSGADVVDVLRALSVTDGTPVVLLQSSGTTGPARVIQLPVTALLQAAWAVRGMVDPHPRFLAFLPAAHVSHQLINVFSATLLGGEVCFGGGGGIGRDAEDLIADLRRSQPTVLFGSPLLFAGVVEEARRALQRGAAGRALWRRLERHAAGTVANGRIVRGREPLLGRLIGRRLRKALGLQHAREIFSGTSPLDAGLHAFLGTLGWFVRNTYGLSESGGAATVSAGDRMVPGELGTPVEGVELEVDWEGQLWLRGPSMMRGYVGGPVLDAGEWLPTGDLVGPDRRGALCFHTRASSLVPTADGLTSLDAIERTATRMFPGTRAVAVAAGDDTVDLYLFCGQEGGLVTPRDILGAPGLECVGRAAVVPGSPSPARFEIGPTGKARRWMIERHWQEFLLGREERLLPVG